MTNSLPCPRCGQDAVITAHRRSDEVIDTGKSLDFTFWCPRGHSVPESELMLMWRIPDEDCAPADAIDDGGGAASGPDRDPGPLSHPRPHRPIAAGRPSRPSGRPGQRGPAPRHR